MNGYIRVLRLLYWGNDWFNSQFCLVVSKLLKTWMFLTFLKIQNPLIIKTKGLLDVSVIQQVKSWSEVRISVQQSVTFPRFGFDSPLILWGLRWHLARGHQPADDIKQLFTGHLMNRHDTIHEAQRV